MREAIGSSWLVYLLVIFLLIYIFFMGFVMNYASAYRAANYVVSQIENCQGRNEVGCSGGDFKSIQADIRAKYHYTGSKGGGMSVCCIENGTGSVYRVILPVDFDVPLLGTINWLKVKAETKTVLNYSCSDSKISKCQ